MAWVLLLVAGLLEIVWAAGLKSGRIGITIVAMAASMTLLWWATRTLPLGTAYGIWVGIGALGTSIFGMAALGEPITTARLLFLGLLVVSIAGLKMSG